MTMVPDYVNNPPKTEFGSLGEMAGDLGDMWNSPAMTGGNVPLTSIPAKAMLPDLLDVAKHDQGGLADGFGWGMPSPNKIIDAVKPAQSTAAKPMQSAADIYTMF